MSIERKLAAIMFTDIAGYPLPTATVEEYNKVLNYKDESN